MTLQSMGRGLFAFLVLGAAFGRAPAETYAIVVGVNDYPATIGARDHNGNPANPDLLGCVNDANGMDAVLREKLGVGSALVRRLVDGQATLPGLVEQLSWVSSTVKPGDQLFFYFSGQGSLLASDDEPEGVAEAIVLADGSLVPLAFFRELSSHLSLGGIHSTYVFDAGFASGAPGPRWRTKFLDLSRSTSFRRITRDELKPAFAQLEEGSEGRPQGETAMLLAGQEEDLVQDLDASHETPAQGHFTLRLLSVLREQPKLGLSDLLDAMAGVVLEDIEFTQAPRLEASSAERASLPLLR